MRAETIEVGGEYYDELALCGNKDDNGNLVDQQTCVCFTDLCNAMWKEDQAVKNSAAISTAMAIVSIFIAISSIMYFYVTQLV